MADTTLETVRSTLDFMSGTEISELFNEALLEVVSVKKGTLILEEGQICKHLYYLINGSVRQYGVKDGDEINFLFYFDDEYFFDEPSFYTKTTSKYSFQSLEDSNLLKFNSTIFDKYHGDARFDRFLFRLSRENVQRLYKRNEVLLMNTPEERYMKLLEIHPKIIEKVSLAKIATFIGIAAPSLSRIRRRLVQGQIS